MTDFVIRLRYIERRIPLFGSAPSSDFDSLASKSRSLHGHMYVLPVAAWMLRSGVEVVEVSDAMKGLHGRADRPRIIEALEKLDEIGAVRELERGGQRNSPRIFSKTPNPYWNFVSAYLADGRPGEIGVGP